MERLIIDDERTFDFDEYDACLCRTPRIYYERSSDSGLSALARLYTEFNLRYGDQIELWLDHDLGNDDDIGIVVDFLTVVPMQEMVTCIYVHSQNPSSDRIVPVLKKAGYNCQRSPLPKLKSDD